MSWGTVNKPVVHIIEQVENRSGRSVSELARPALGDEHEVCPPRANELERDGVQRISIDWSHPRLRSSLHSAHPTSQVEPESPREAADRPMVEAAELTQIGRRGP